jgi:C_GCAxxG_C_C family probable redox protein
MLAVGEYYLDNIDDQMIKMSTGLAGGVGGNYKDLCGAYTAGVMVISGLYGRTQASADDQRCLKLVNEYRQRLMHQFSTVYCWELRTDRFGSGNLEPCSALVSKAVEILLDVLEEQS